MSHALTERQEMLEFNKLTWKKWAVIPFCLVALLLIFLLSSCGFNGASAQPATIPTQTNSQAIIQRVPTNTLSPSPTMTPLASPTISPSPTLEPTPSITQPKPTPTRRPTAVAYCDDQLGIDLSPNQNWVAATCYGKVDDSLKTIEDSSLRVVSLTGSVEWEIRFGDYARGAGYDRKDLIVPFHWSEDGRYLYATAYQRGSGCCWLGSYIMLIRLNLATGRQDAIVNLMPDAIHPGTLDFSFSPGDRYLIYTRETRGTILIVLDLLTWESQAIDLYFQNVVGAGDPLMSPDEDEIVLLILEWADYPNYEFGTVTSLIYIDLKDGSQTRLISRMNDLDELYPVRWENEGQVLLSSSRDYPCSGELWLLDVHTGEMTGYSKENCQDQLRWVNFLPTLLFPEVPLWG